jgi:integrase
MKKSTTSNGKHKRASKGAGRLYKRDAAGGEHPAEWNGTGAYWLAYSIPNPDGGIGQRVRVPLRDDLGNTITDREQAESKRKQIMAPYQTGDHAETLRALQARIQDAESAHVQAVDEANPPLRVKDTWQAYLQEPERPDSGPLTLEQYEGHWYRFENWIGTAHPEAEYLRDVTRATAAEYASDLSKAKLSGNRFNKHIGFLRLCFRALGDVARITANPFEKIKRKNQRPHSRRELTIMELTTILDHADGDLALLLYLGATTGLRLGDCCTLTWGETDLVRGIIRRVPNKTAKNGKPVVVGIPRALHDRLAGRGGKKRTGYVLPKVAEQYRRDPTIITNMVKDHVLECGIDVHAPDTGHRIKRKDDGTPERDKKTGSVITIDTEKAAVVEVGFHSLRHTWVSMHAAAGTPGAVIQESVGHSNPAMTAHYTHVNENTARDVARTLPMFAGDGEQQREPLPAWAVKLVETLTEENVKTVKTALLKGGAQ